MTTATDIERDLQRELLHCPECDKKVQTGPAEGVLGQSLRACSECGATFFMDLDSKPEYAEPAKQQPTPRPWALSSPMVNQTVAKDLKISKTEFQPIGIDVPDEGKSTHYGGVLCFGNPERAALIVRAVNAHDGLVRELQEVKRTLQALLTCDYCATCEHCNGNRIIRFEINAIDEALKLAEA